MADRCALVLAAVFFAEGVTRTIVFFQVRPLPGAGWILVDGVLFGTIVGINLVVTGFTREKSLQ